MPPEVIIGLFEIYREQLFFRGAAPAAHNKQPLLTGQLSVTFQLRSPALSGRQLLSFGGLGRCEVAFSNRVLAAWERMSVPCLTRLKRCRVHGPICDKRG
jgi:hypothetical protein